MNVGAEREENKVRVRAAQGNRERKLGFLMRGGAFVEYQTLREMGGQTALEMTCVVCAQRDVVTVEAQYRERLTVTQDVLSDSYR